VDWLSGACLAVRGDLLREIGGLDERYFLYYEDEELCLQVRRRGYEVVLLPQLQAMHIGGASSQPGTTWPHLYRSMLIFFGSHRRSSYQLLRLVVLVRALLGVGLAQSRRLLRRSSAEPRFLVWRGIAAIALL
jgi:GT2 family glycosyltransferase